MSDTNKPELPRFCEVCTREIVNPRLSNQCQPCAGFIAQHDKELLAAVRPPQAHTTVEPLQAGFDYCLSVFDRRVQEYQQRKGE